ncbi:hypothetical protein ACO0LD_06765 [Undibacterium sp. Ji83W]|uniref:hypothetical protein n=1 Tax=Undibacterium sp. Ji83W TaxID=3413043 RepID=UPI003BF43C60
MINLRSIFEDAITSLDNGSTLLQIKSLPISVLMMQKDVINHYKYAIWHYFQLNLNESFLQNSSLGTPYEKWRKFTNDDFELLFQSIKLLVTFTGRLYHESELFQRTTTDEVGTFKTDSNRYTTLICDFKYADKKLGIAINSDESLEISELVPEGIFLNNRWSSVKTTATNISDRSVLKVIAANALAEISVLEDLHNAYKEKCRAFVKKFDIFEDYENLHQDYWLN